jgi:lipoate-protein ligase A
MVGASVVLPRLHPLVAPGIVSSYRWLGEAHVRALAQLGVQASVVPPPMADAGDPNQSGLRWACFGTLSPWEVVGRDRRKLVGLAQVRRGTGVLFVAGTLVSTPDWRAFAAAMGQPATAARDLTMCTTSCESESGRHVAAESVANALAEELVACIDQMSAPGQVGIAAAESPASRHVGR